MESITTLEKLEQIHFCIVETIDREDLDLDLLCRALDLIEDIREPYLTGVLTRNCKDK